MSDLATIRIPVDSSDMVKAVRDAKALESNINTLVKAFDSGAITSGQFQKGLLQLKNKFKDLFTDVTQANFRVTQFASNLIQSSKAIEQAAEMRNWFSAQRRRMAMMQESERIAKRQADEETKAAERIAAAQEKATQAIIKQRAAAEQAASSKASSYQAGIGSSLGLGAQGISAASSASAFEQDIERLRQKYDKVYSASKLYEQQLNELNKAHLYGITTVKQHEAAVSQLNLEYEQFSNAAQGAYLANNRFSQHINETSRGLNNFGMYAQQVGYQVGDFFVQVQSGTNILVAFGQQATQLAGLIPGVWGAAIGIGISLATALGAAWMRTSEETTKGAKEQKNAYDQLRESLNQYIRAKEAASKGLTQDQLTVAEQIANAQKTLDEAVLKLKEAREAYLTMAVLTPGADVGLAPESNPALDKAIKDREDAERTLYDLRTKMLDTYFKEAEELNKTNQLEVTKLLYGEKSVEYKKALAEEERRHYEESVRNLGINETYVQALLRQYDRMVANREEAERVSKFVDKIFESIDKASKVDLSKVFAEAAPFAQGLLNTVKDIYGKMLAAANVKAITEKNARESKDYSGRGGDPRDFMEGGSKSYDPNFRPFDPSMIPKSSKGGSKTNPLDSLINQLQTERETIDEWYATSQDMLKNASESELQIIGGYNEAKLRLEKEYQEKLAGLKIDAQKNSEKQLQSYLDIYQGMTTGNLSSQLGGWADYFNNLNSLSGNQFAKLAQLAKVFGAAQALSNSYLAYTQALADPTLPWFAKFAAAGSVLAAGLGAVAAIRSGGGSVGRATSSGRGSATVANSAPAQTPQTVYIDSIKPESLYSGETLIKLFDSFYDENDKRGKVFMVAR